MLHKFVRIQLEERLVQYAAFSQNGGIGKRGTDSTSLHLTLMQEVYHHKQYSSAFVFLDVRAAFDSACRAFLIEGSNERGIEPILLEAGVDPTVIRWVRAFHKNTWYKLDRSSDFCLFSQGVKQGDPLGDILYNFLMASLIKALRKGLAARGLESLFPFAAGPVFQCCGERDVDHVPCQDASYMDDLFVAVATPQGARP